MGALQLTIKTLQHKQFKLEVDSSDTVLAVKEKIEKSEGHPVNQLKLIFSGKILADEQKIEEYNITEKDFLVLMVSKPKKTTTTTASTSKAIPKEPVKQEEAPAAAPAATTPNTTTEASAPTPVSPATTAASTPVEIERPSSQTGQIDSNSQLVTGNQLEGVIQNMMEMGFERDQCVRALRASFNNPDRAVEYLFNGIPQHILDEMNFNQQQSEQASTPAAAPTPAAATTNTTNPTSGTPLNLFAAAQQQAQQQAQEQAQQQTVNYNHDIEALRSTPYFQQIRQLVQTNPALLQPLLQQLGQSHPEILRSISADPNGFLQALMEAGDDEDTMPPGTSMIQVTQEEKDAIDRLAALGFDRHLVIEAYFACEKNEELAANYLFEHGSEDFE
ncbi:uncharacterized protein BX663DRAFT_493775 [Cokeromyces recurvatus]|uniref:uncharacterized protein n=1 Tax=Cokeromyces recurvatus TaxID=90255 RepID=UPI0022212853|nr:uncharacterized protein BX663DRAFT_493775 [Cokeromyces recurvatus]KAI7908312.1 hypothetical protein BX663DRAFT_493775 [Cokeromyces recurvatus]